MEKVLRPSKLEIDASSPESALIFKFWKRQLHNLIATTFADKTDAEKLPILTQFLTHQTYPLIEEATTYSAALELLNQQFAKEKNECYARHLLYSRRQKPVKVPSCLADMVMWINLMVQCPDCRA